MDHCGEPHLHTTIYYSGISEHLSHLFVDFLSSLASSLSVTLTQFKWNQEVDGEGCMDSHETHSQSSLWHFETYRKRDNAAHTTGNRPTVSMATLRWQMHTPATLRVHPECLRAGISPVPYASFRKHTGWSFDGPLDLGRFSTNTHTH